MDTVLAVLKLINFFLSVRFLLDKQKPVKSQTIWGKSYCDFNLKHRVKEKKVRQEFIDYLQTHSLVVELWGSQGQYRLFTDIDYLQTIYRHRLSTDYL
jgi:hypothetical protein